MNDDGTFTVQVINDSVHQLDKLMKEFRAFHDAGSHTAQNVKVGDLVAAKFSGDHEFYRARVKKIDRVAQKADIVGILHTLTNGRYLSTMAIKNQFNYHRFDHWDSLHSVHGLVKLKTQYYHSSQSPLATQIMV